MVGRRGAPRDVPAPPVRSLLAERARLVARLGEIDRLLGNRRETAVHTPPERRGQP